MGVKVLSSSSKRLLLRSTSYYKVPLKYITWNPLLCFPRHLVHNCGLLIVNCLDSVRRKPARSFFPHIPDASRPQPVCVTGYLIGESKEKKSASGDEEERGRRCGPRAWQ